MSTLRGCPPRWVCGGGISGAKIPHCASVRSEGYRFRDRPSVAKCVYSFTGEACANCLPNQAFCQGQFPESLLDQGGCAALIHPTCSGASNDQGGCATLIHNIEENLLRNWLAKRGVSKVLIKRALHQLDKAAALGEGKSLYDANRAVYSLLRYGVKVKEGAGEQYQTVWLIDWEHPKANHFAIAEEVSVKGELTKRPDVVLYVNGIALGVLELKRSTVSVSEGIRQNLDNQKKAFIRAFFSTVQLVMAGNDTEGLRYGIIETPEKYYLTWKEESDIDNSLDRHLIQLCNKPRLLEIIHDFIVFDAGVKKTCRHNQYFGVK